MAMGVGIVGMRLLAVHSRHRLALQGQGGE